MTLTGKPEPVPDQDSSEFWAAASQHRLVVQQCGACGHRQLYPRLYCTQCHASTLVMRDATGLGVVYASTVIRRATSPAFQREVPYSLALVELDEGPRMMANIVECDPASVQIGMRVEVAFEDLTGATVPRFRPLRDNSARVTRGVER